MQPNAPSPAPPQPDYDFILNHGANKPKSPLLPKLGNSKKQRWLMIGAGGGLLLIILLLLFSAVFGGNKNQSLLEVAQAQQELIRVSTLGASKNSSAAARNLAVTTKLTIETNQKEMIDQLKKQGQKTNTKLLDAKKNTQTDATLTQAAQDNRYDEIFTQQVQQQLMDYQQQLKAAYDGTSSKSLKQLLNNEFAEAGLLIKSSKSS